jgi:hypothetical protein
MLKISEGYRDIDVEVVSYTRDLGPQSLSLCGLTWHCNDISKLNEEGKQVLIDKILNNKTSPKISEVGKVTFIFKNISRVCLARLTRDQCEAINAESQATPSFGADMKLSSKHVERRTTVPLNIVKDPELYAEYKGILDMIEAYQQKLEKLDFAWAPDIRYIGSMGTQIDIAIQYNLRQFVACCNKRFINAINDEDNYAMRKARFALIKKIEADVASGSLDHVSQAIWSGAIANCDPSVDFVDNLLGKEFNRGKPFRGDGDTHIYRREQTAWYHELLRMRDEEPELLLDGEIQMIDKWREKNKIVEEVGNDFIPGVFV